MLHNNVEWEKLKHAVSCATVPCLRTVGRSLPDDIEHLGFRIGISLASGVQGCSMSSLLCLNLPPAPHGREAGRWNTLRRASSVQISRRYLMSNPSPSANMLIEPKYPTIGHIRTPRHFQLQVNQRPHPIEKKHVPSVQMVRYTRNRRRDRIGL
jgi:hypothetical protein